MVIVLFAGLITGILLAVGINAVYHDMYVKRSYEWLINRYLPTDELLAKANCPALQVIEISGGTTKEIFRSLVMKRLKNLK